MTLAKKLDSSGAEPKPGGGIIATIRRMSSVLMLLGIMALFALVVILWLNNRNAFPSEGSPEVGFARDMIVHHNQAVQLALLLYDRSENETLRTMALDMLLSQQTQIGQMQGWLYLWGVPIASTDLPMAWMGMLVEGLMPGMATDQQIARLRDSSGVDADRQFIALMIPHHESGIHMAQAIMGVTHVPAVQKLASSIIDTQQREIDELRQVSTQLENSPAD